jgi:hypothetical protein
VGAARNNPVQPDKKAPAPPAKSDPAPALVKARVRPNGRYGEHRAGAIVEVEPNELNVCKHVLVALDKEGEEAEQAKAASEATRTDTSLFRAARSAGRSSAQMLRERAERAEDEKTIASIERLRRAGISIGISPK